MGQYYYPTLMGSRYGIKGWLYSHEYDNGLKLMEHSYMGNRFVNVVLAQIHNNPMRLAWMGDYADDWGDEPTQEPYTTKLPRHRFMKIFDNVVGDNGNNRSHKISPKVGMEFEGPEDFSGWYLINHTQQTFLDLGKYAEENFWEEEWNGKTYKSAINPLPLLTACGNGRGGGDYHDCYPDYDKVGTWAFDVIELTDCRPVGFKEEHYGFTEQRKVTDDDCDRAL